MKIQTHDDNREIPSRVSAHGIAVGVAILDIANMPRCCRWGGNHWCCFRGQEAFMRGTEKYAHETQLSKRVGAWQEKLEPLMERRAPSRRRLEPALGRTAVTQRLLHV